MIYMLGALMLLTKIGIYMLGVVADVLITIIAVFFVNWWAPALSDSSGNLPRWLYWFQTFDATLDAGWQGGYFVASSLSWYLRPLALFYFTGSPGTAPTGLNLFLLRVRWLYRNPAYGFDYFAFGLPFDPSRWRVLKYVNTPTLSLFIAIGDGFNIEYAGRLGELKLGWKAWNYWNNGQWKTVPWGPEWIVPLCFTYTPFKRI
jgi:hypothetical protein